jgi:integrase
MFQRGQRLYVKIKNAAGQWEQVATGYAVGEEAAAEAWAAAQRRQIAAEVRAGSTGGPLTVRTFAAGWLERRKLLVADWRNDEQRLRDHVLPVLGHLRLVDVHARHLVDLFADLRSSGALAQRTIYNVYSVISALLRDAELAGVIDRAPTRLTHRELGSKVDRDPTQRGEAVFARGEVERLISDDAIPPDRHVVYALGALAGLRHGEIAGLRWRHYDPTREPLGLLTIATSYDRGRTKTGVIRRVPVHPTLAAVLGEWRLGGWGAMLGRQPGADDLVVPLELDAPNKQARPNPRAGGMRNKNDSRKRWVTDLAQLGLRHRRGHDLRATFVTLAEDDGADRAVIEQVTHTRRGRGAYDGYSRTQWATLCREVAKLQIGRRLGAVVVQWAQDA